MKHNIDDMTFGELKQIAAMFNCAVNAPESHPLQWEKVLVILPHGFIYFGTLDIDGGQLFLKDASNLRYWSKRDNGLAEFAEKGPVTDDRIDKLNGPIFFNNQIAIIPCGEWNE